MAALGNVEITFEFEPIVKLICTATNCRFNLMNSELPAKRYAVCNLKHITLNHIAACTQFERIEPKIENVE